MPERSLGWENTANVSQLCGQSVNSSVKRALYASSLLGNTLDSNHHFSFAIWTVVMELLLCSPAEERTEECRACLIVTLGQKEVGDTSLVLRNTCRRLTECKDSHSFGLKVSGQPTTPKRKNDICAIWRVFDCLQVRKLNAII